MQVIMDNQESFLKVKTWNKIKSENLTLFSNMKPLA